MSYQEGKDRCKMQAFSLENFVSQNHIVRVVDDFVESLDLTPFNIKSMDSEDQEGEIYHPQVLLKIHLYGYVNQVESCKELVRVTKDYMTFKWLVHQLTPDLETITNFRKENKKSLKVIFRAFSEYCYNMKLLNLKLIATDGSYIKAIKHGTKKCTSLDLEGYLDIMDNKIAIHFLFIDTNDNLNKEDELTYDELIEQKNNLDNIIEFKKKMKRKR